jgi:FKBP-type peptidyl-prolyl cis-trans isomerase FkpA
MSVTAVPLQPVKRSYKLWLWLGVIVAVLAAFGMAWMGTRAAAAARGSADQFLAWNKGRIGIHTTASGLQYQLVKAGSGPNAVDGDGASVTVFGTKRDGSVFQPSAPLQVPVGQGTIKGFSEALKLMNKGSKYRFWLPPELGYNEAGPQHPLYGQVLIFDIEMNELIPAEQLRQMMMQQMMMQQQQGGAPGGPGGPAGPQQR